MTDPAAVRYRLRLTPDLKRFDFAGQVDIHLQADRPVAAIGLNVLELAVWRCAQLDGETLVQCAFTLDPASETLTIHLPEARAGAIVLRIDYQGRINDRMAGFYRSRYTGRRGSGVIAVTQFQESDARRAFPCIDHPGAKAVFEITLVAPDGLKAVGNQPVAAETALPGGLREIQFAPTPQMSTYLVFFGLGPFQAAVDEIDTRVRVLMLPGQEERGRFGLAFGRQALTHCERYFGIAYPLSKLDLIAVPDFAFGAMENWGAITFRENLLLHDSKTTSRQAEVRIAEVIAHEIVHQWFGNLVTPADWKYLWLNESFATYGAYRIVDDQQPDWEAWGQFVQGHTAVALERDALRATPAIEIPGGQHVVINSGTAPIIYSKGGSLLRQIEGYIGPDDFRRGMHRYLASHAYRCSTSRHLWEAFEAASAKPVVRMVQQWVSLPGHPLVTVHRDGDDLVLEQRRFAYLPLETDQCWPIPLTVRAFDAGGQDRRLERLFESETLRLSLPPDTVAYKINDGHSGFYRTCYADPADLARLGPMVAAGRLGPDDRWGLQEDLFAMVRAGRLRLSAYLDWLDHYRGEAALLPLLGMAANLKLALLVTTGGRHAAVADLAGRMAAAQLDRIGVAPAPQEPLAAALLREQMIWLGLISADPGMRQRLVPVVERLLAGRTVHPDLLQASLQAAAMLAGPAALDWFEDRLEKTDSEHERLAILGAMGAFGDWATAEAALAWVLVNIPDRNRFVPVVAAAANPVLTASMWPWFMENHSRLETMHPLLYERVLVTLMAISGLSCADAVRDFARRHVDAPPALAAVIEMGLERLEINRRMRTDEA